MKNNIVGMETNMEQLLDKACAKFLIFVLVEVYVISIAYYVNVSA